MIAASFLEILGAVTAVFAVLGCGYALMAYGINASVDYHRSGVARACRVALAIAGMILLVTIVAWIGTSTS